MVNKAFNSNKLFISYWGNMEFLKKLFGSTPEKISINTSELHEWLDLHSKGKLNDVNKNIKRLINHIESIKTSLTLNLETLEFEKIGDASVFGKKELQIMHGNRDNFIKKTNLFLEHIVIPDFDYLKIANFCKDFEEHIHEFNEDTRKPYYILSNFFDTTMKKIALNLKDFENTIVQLFNATKTAEVTEFKTLKSKINELNDVLNQSDDLEEDIKLFVADLENSIKKQEKAKLKIEKLKESREYRKIKKFERELLEIDDICLSIKSKITNQIKNFEKAFRKIYHKQKTTSIYHDYLDYPLKTIVSDENLKVIDEIDKLKEDITKTNITIKNKDKILNKNINKEKLISLRSEYILLVEKKSQINNEMDKPLIIMDYKEQQYTMEHLTEKNKRLKEDISDKKNILKHLNYEDKRKKLETRLSDFSGYIVTII